jgi:multidrug resistance efflux pump
VVAPFDGFIASAEVRAGETVSAGQVMAQLDDKDLLAEQRRLRSSRAEIQKEYRKALAELNHAQARILQAKIAQADARVAHLDDQLARARLTAPLGGMVITGDWTRSLDAPVNRGDVLFEVAPLADYRVVLLVKDSDIALLEPGQPGELRLTGLPGTAIPLIVGEVATLAEPDAEGALFRVEAEPQDHGLALRPGMEGIAKVVVGERRRLWIWTHGLTDWLRLQLWRWWP